MTVQSGSATIKEKEVKTKWPVTAGNVLGTTKIEGRQINLVPEEESLIRQEFLKGL